MRALSAPPRLRTQFEKLELEAAGVGLKIFIWNPADRGGTRYRFFRFSEIEEGRQSFFTPDTSIHTAFGLRQAQEFVRAYTLGREGAKPERLTFALLVSALLNIRFGNLSKERMQEVAGEALDWGKLKNSGDV